MNFVDIEYAGFRSLPAEQQVEFDGVVLRFTSGYTKRANSATVLSQQNGDLTRLVKRCEQHYQEKGLPCIFRLPSFAKNQQLDDYLELNGYQFVDHSLVLYRSLEEAIFRKEKLNFKQPVDWLKSYCKISNTELNLQQRHIERLNRVKDKLLLAVLSESNRDVACALSVISNQYCGIFDVITENSVRNKGIGTRLLNGMLNWAISNGATTAYIQVVANNLPAINLYKKLGYQVAYEYHYRVKSNP